MFGLVCAKCGHPETLHLGNYRGERLPELEELFKMNIDHENGYLEVPVVCFGRRITWSEFLNQAGKIKRGYRLPLLKWHNFKYCRDDESFVVEQFVTKPLDAPDPPGLSKRILRGVMRKEKIEAKKYEGPWTPPVHAYLLFGHGGFPIGVAIGE